jgi:hypothetical protein
MPAANRPGPVRLGDVVVIMQIEIQPPRPDEALSLVEELAAAQLTDAAMRARCCCSGATGHRTWN